LKNGPLMNTHWLPPSVPTRKVILLILPFVTSWARWRYSYRLKDLQVAVF